MGNELWDTIEEGYEEATNWNALQGHVKNNKKEAKKKNYLALYNIHSSLKETILLIIAGYKIAKDAWKYLKDGYEGGNMVKHVKLQTLRRYFKILKMKDNERDGYYCVQVKDVTDKMATPCEDLENSCYKEGIVDSQSQMEQCYNDNII